MIKSLMVCVLFLTLLAVGCDVAPPPYTGPHYSVEVNDATFASVVLASEQPVLVDFWASWCGPCRQLTPIVEQIAGEYEGRVTVAKVNVDDAPDVTAQYEIEGIPSLVFFRKGQVVEKLVGVQSKRKLTQTLDAMLAE